MRTEFKKSSPLGFVLTEAELRRILGTIEDQLRKISADAHIHRNFSMKFRDGTLAITSSLDEVLMQENIGSSQIVRLTIECSLNQNTHTNSISIEFVDLSSEDDPQAKPISYAVKGESRDWTFVTSSLVEERLLKIERLPLTLFLGGDRKGVSSPYFILFLAGLIVALVYLTVSSYINPYSDESLRREQPSNVLIVSDKLESALREKATRDPIEAILLRDKLVENLEMEREIAWKSYEDRRDRDIKEYYNRRFLSLVYLPAFMLILPLGLYVLRKFVRAYLPAFNFCWGDYLDVFNKKESQRRFILVVLLAGLVLSFLGGVLANFTGIGK